MGSIKKNFLSDGIKILTLAVGLMIATGCANRITNKDPIDPFESFNRFTFGLNSVVDTVAIKPVAWTYDKTVPPPGKLAVGNFLSNLSLFPTIANDILQARFDQAFKDSLRLAVNSTFGILGIFDIAKYFKLPKHHTNFGDTMYKWGWRRSMYVVVPIFGPSTARDTFGRLDMFLSPMSYHSEPKLRSSTSILGLVHYRAEFLEKEKILLASAVDPYTVFKDAYLQYRHYQLDQQFPKIKSIEITQNSDNLNSQTSDANTNDEFMGEPPL